MRQVSSFSCGLLAIGWLGTIGLSAAACGSDPVTEGAGVGAPAAGGTAGTTGGLAGGGTTGGSGSVPTAPDAGGPLVTTPGSVTPPSMGPCQHFTIGNGRITPDMLIVLDRSSSMRGQGVDRWTPSVSGLKAVTGELDDMIRFGLMAFPGRGAGGLLGGGMQCAAGSLEVPIGLNASPAIATSLDGLALVQTTPTASTLEAAHGVLGSGAAALDMTTVAKYVILVTDGAPNCSDGTAGGGGGRGNDAAAVAASVAAIQAMQKDGIKTYVLGYDTQSDAMLKAALDEMAKAGGTGDTQHRAIEDEASLVQEFRRILGSAASCEFALNMPPSDPNFVLVTLDGTKLALNQPDGFSLSADRKRLTITGSSCATLQGQTGNHTVSVTVQCERQTLF